MTRRPLPEWDGLEALEDRRLLAFILWDGGGGDLSWNNPLNWSGDALPGVADHVLIDAPGQPTIHLDSAVTNSIGSLWSLDPIEISAGTLSVSGQWRQVGALTMTGGRIDGGANLAVSAAFLWSGGTIAGSATKIQVLPGATLTIAGDVSLSRQLVNNGSVVWESGDIDLAGGRITNLRDRTFLIESDGAMSGVGSRFINYGTVLRDGAVGGTTTIGVTFSNFIGQFYVGWPPAGYPSPAGVVDVRSGTLAFGGPVIEKVAEVLRGGEWHVGDAGRLLLPGVNLEYVYGPVVMDGPGAAFPQLESIEYIERLTLSGGRQFTFHFPGPPPFGYQVGIRSLIIDSPGVTTTIADRLSIDSLQLIAGAVNAAAGLSVSGYSGAFELGPGTMLTLGGESTLRYIQVSGAGLLRITGETRWIGGSMVGGPLQVLTTGHLTLAPGDNYYVSGHKWLERRLVNYGTLDWENPGWGYYTDSELEFTGEIVNRGTFNIRSPGFAMPYLGVQAPGTITNFGTINVTPPFGTFTLRGAGGGVMLNNAGGTVHVASGSMVLNGRTAGGGVWQVDQGAELVFGGLPGTLNGATILGAGRVRVASVVAWTQVNVSGTGDVLITPYGRLTVAQTVEISRSLVTNHGTIRLDGGAAANLLGSLISHGTLDVGTGVLYVGHDLTMGGASTTRVRCTSATSFGRIRVDGSAAVAGNLVVSFGWSPLTGASFDFFTTQARTGSFASADSDGTLPAGKGVRFAFAGSVGRVTVVQLF